MTQSRQMFQTQGFISMQHMTRMVRWMLHTALCSLLNRWTSWEPSVLSSASVLSQSATPEHQPPHHAWPHVVFLQTQRVNQLTWAKVASTRAGGQSSQNLCHDSNLYSSLWFRLISSSFCSSAQVTNNLNPLQQFVSILTLLCFFFLLFFFRYKTINFNLNRVTIIWLFDKSKFELIKLFVRVQWFSAKVWKGYLNQIYCMFLIKSIGNCAPQ